MATTLYGTLADRSGYAMWDVLDDNLRHDVVASAQPAANFQALQPADVRIDIDHDPDQTCGRCVYFERHAGDLWSVAVINRDFDLPADEALLYWSAAVTGRRRSDSAVHTDLRLRAVTLTTTPAAYGLKALRSLPGDIRDWDDARRWRKHRELPALIERAIDWVRSYRRGDPLEIVEPHAKRAPVAERADSGYPDREPADAGPLVIRNGGRVLSVR